MIAEANAYNAHHLLTPHRFWHNLLIAHSLLHHNKGQLLCLKIQIKRTLRMGITGLFSYLYSLLINHANPLLAKFGRQKAQFLGMRAPRKAGETRSG